QGISSDRLRGEIMTTATESEADLLESTRSETVPLLSDDLHHLYGSSTTRRRGLLGKKPFRGGCSNCCNSCCSEPTMVALKHRAESLFQLLFPFYSLISGGSYSSKALVSDLLAGLTMSVFHIPQGLANSLLAGLKPINGLYTSLIPVALYSLIGRSLHQSIGTFSLTSLLLADMIGTTYRQYMDQLPGSNSTISNCSLYSEVDEINLNADCSSDSDEYYGGLTVEEYARLQVAVLGSFAASVINMALGTLQLGFVMKYVSNPMLRGFTTAAAVHIFTSQVPMLLGVQPTGGDNFVKLIASYTGIINDIASTNWTTVITSVACMVPLYLMKEYLNPRVKKCIKVPLPVELLIILSALVASHALQLQSRFSVDVVGTVPRGLPLPLVPDFSFMPNVLLPCLPVSLVGAAMSLSIGKMYALQFDYEVNYNGELFVLGTSSLFGSFFQCFYATGALARCTVVVGAGMKSQVASAVSCLVLLLVVLAVGPLFEAVPECALASVIVVSLVGVFKQVTDIPKLWREAKYLDLSTWLLTAVSVLVLDVSLGLAVGFCYSLACTLVTRCMATRREGQPGDSDARDARRRGSKISVSYSSNQNGSSSAAVDVSRVDSATKYPMMIGWDSFNDEPRSGRPRTSVTEDVVAHADAIIREDWSIMLRFLAYELGVSYGSAHNIMHEQLGRTKTCARWVPHLLTPEQQAERDKQSNMVWLAEDEPRPEVLKTGFRSRKRMFTIFFNSQGVVSVNILPAGATVTARYYTDTVLPGVLQERQELIDQLQHNVSESFRVDEVQRSVETDHFQPRQLLCRWVLADVSVDVFVANVAKDRYSGRLGAQDHGEQGEAQTDSQGAQTDSQLTFRMSTESAATSHMIKLRGEIMTTATESEADLLESTRSETVPLLSDDLHHLYGSSTTRRRGLLGKKPFRGRCSNCCNSCCSEPTMVALKHRAGSLFQLLFPFYSLISGGSYSSKALVSDLLAGLTMSVFHIPQGLANSLLAGLKPINGLYTSLIPVALYSLIGRSLHQSIGTFSLTSLLLADMIGTTYQVDEINLNADCSSDSDEYYGGLTVEEYARLQVAVLGSFAASVINMALGTLQLGFVMKYVSNPMLRGFTTAAAVHIFTSQVPMLLGVQPTGGDNFVKLIASYTGIINDIASTNWGNRNHLRCVHEYLNPRVKKCIKVPLPVELLIILSALVASHALQLQSRFGVDVVGTVPRGLPLPLVPDFSFMPNVLLPCLPVSLVGAAMSLSIGKMYALQFDYEVNYNGELFVLGTSSLFGSFFQCFYATGALARCTVVVGAGMKSQVASAVSCLVVLLVVLAVAPLFEAVPECALASVIVVSLVGVFKQVTDIPKLWREAKYLDLSTWLLTAVSVLVLDVSLGLAVGFCYSLACTLVTRCMATRREGQPGDSDARDARRRGSKISVSYSSNQNGSSSAAVDVSRVDSATKYPMMIGRRAGQANKNCCADGVSHEHYQSSTTRQTVSNSFQSCAFFKSINFDK
uniref:STAS domain-containing protein n=1 Tax=Macrostomum lignano TaxID=282301 RepID=A0A1I8HMT8_9PLAT